MAARHTTALLIAQEGHLHVVSQWAVVYTQRRNWMLRGNNPLRLVHKLVKHIGNTVKESWYSWYSSLRSTFLSQKYGKTMNHEIDSLVSLHQIIIKHFSLEELRTLCFNIGVDYDVISGDDKESKSRELILYLSRRDLIQIFIQKLTSLRSDIDTAPPLISTQNHSMESTDYTDIAIKGQADTHYRLAILHLINEEIEEASHMCEMALSLTPNDYRLHIIRGYIFRLSNKYEKAVEAYRKGMEILRHHSDLNPDDSIRSETYLAQTLNNLCYMASVMGNDERALSFAEQAIQTDPFLPEPFFTAAKTHDRMDNEQQASFYYQQYIKLTKKSEGIRKQRAREARSRISHIRSEGVDTRKRHK